MSLEPQPRRVTSSPRSCASVQIKCHFKKEAFLLLTKLSVQPNPLSTSMWLLGPPVPGYFHGIPAIIAHYRPLPALQLKLRNSLLPAKWRLLKICAVGIPASTRFRKSCIVCLRPDKMIHQGGSLSSCRHTECRHHLSDMSAIFLSTSCRPDQLPVL